MYMWKIFISSGICALILLGAAFTLRHGESSLDTEKTGMVIIRDLGIPVVVADTPVLQEQGLSGRKILSQDSGMFFVMETSALHGFWMKDMLFPIDIIWIDESLHVVSIIANAAPESYPSVFYPSSPAKYVLEVNAGFARMHGISAGDAILFERTQD